MLLKYVFNVYLKGEIYFYDLDYSLYYVMINCCLIDIEGMLLKGFMIGNVNVESLKFI